jgi:predicted PurR-regulated permease PerM
MLETFLLVILLPASIILNIILLNRGISYVKQTEQLNDIIKDYDNRQDNTLTTLENMLSELKQIDLNGSFESDDEVGTVFSELKNTIESYKNKI